MSSGARNVEIKASLRREDLPIVEARAVELAKAYPGGESVLLEQRDTFFVVPEARSGATKRLKLRDFGTSYLRGLERLTPSINAIRSGGDEATIKKEMELEKATWRAYGYPV